MTNMSSVEGFPPEDVLVQAYDAFVLAEEDLGNDGMKKFHPMLHETLINASLLDEVLPEIAAMSLSSNDSAEDTDKKKEEEGNEALDVSDEESPAFLTEARTMRFTNRRSMEGASRARKSGPATLLGSSRVNYWDKDDQYSKQQPTRQPSFALAAYRDPFEDMEEYLKPRDRSARNPGYCGSMGPMNPPPVGFELTKDELLDADVVAAAVKLRFMVGYEAGVLAGERLKRQFRDTGND